MALRILVLCILAAVLYTEACRNNISRRRCIGIKSSNRCQTAYAKRVCKATCGHCTKCKDTINTKRCLAIKNKGNCDRKFAKRRCKSTCGYCDKIRPTTPTPPTPTNGPAPTCGIPTYKQSRVIGGTDAKAGAWPWQIAMFIHGRFFCGGSLVTPTLVVTAAHCTERISNASAYSILLGANNLTQRESSWQVIKAKRIINHPRYSFPNNDIALIELVRPAVLNDRVKTVCLPNAVDTVPVGTKCFITGFGKLDPAGGASVILQQADLPIVSQSTCANLNTVSTTIKITPQMVCAGHGPGNIKSGCHGDSGGPLVCRQGSSNAYTLHGAVSWGSPKCTTQETYTVFTRITAYRGWINKYIQV